MAPMSPAFMDSRAALRRFDHDDARALYARGWSLVDLAEHFDVSPAGIRRVVDPAHRATVDRREAERQRQIAGSCRCGRPMTYASMARHRRLGQAPRCQRCEGADRQRTARPRTLLCTTCDQWQPDDAFPFDERRISRRGRHSQCRLCNTNAKRAWRAADPERARATHRRAAAMRRERLRRSPMACPSCGYENLTTKGPEWACRKCPAQSPGYAAASGQTSVSPIAPASTARAAQTYTDDELLAALRAHAEVHGVAPSSKTWDTDRPDGAPSQAPYRDRWGSWSAALAAAGLEPVQVGIGRGQRPAIETYQLVIDYLAVNPGSSKVGAFRAVGAQLGRPWESIRSAYVRGQQQSQPARAAASTPTAAPLAETPAAPPLPDRTHPPVGESPQATPEEAPTEQGVIEAPLATTDLEAPEPTPLHAAGGAIGDGIPNMLGSPGLVLNQRQIQHLRDHGMDVDRHLYGSLHSLDVRERYAGALLATIESYDILSPGDHWLFERLCDRLERILGIASAA